jgi:DNA helicase-2/ATP-dependent DNA helicase PcrA
MPSLSRTVICAAGGGKTTRIVDQAIAEQEQRALLVTYTRNNEEEIRRRIYERCPVVPAHIEVMTWFGFLLRELARPYRRTLHDRRIDGLHFVKGRSALRVSASRIDLHYFAQGTHIYSDKISKFVCECDRRSGGAVMRRLAQRFDHIYIDEIQDVAGYDIDLIELMLKAGIRLTMVGDHRQATFSTNNSNKNAIFNGIRIIDKFRAWDRVGLAKIGYEQHTHRCHQDIADLGDSLFVDEPATKSLNTATTGHDGVFTVGADQVDAYIAAFTPQVLRLDMRTNCRGMSAMNFGESKGLTFDRVLIFPHQLAKKWLTTGSISHIEGSLPKIYVGITRARYSLAFVHDGVVKITGARRFE